MRASLAVLLERFDDEAFAALANRGLLRRAQKDLEKSPPTIVEENDKSLVVSVGEQRVTLDARGPAHAQCTCPTTGSCQHILGAALALKMSLSTQGTVPSVAGESHAIKTDGADLKTALAALDLASLTRHAGKAGYRWACQFVADLEPEHVEIVSGRNLVIAFQTPPVRFRYVGGGPDALLADADLKSLEKYQVAAVLAARRAWGLTIEALPTAAAAPRTAALDLGKDHALGEDSASSQVASRERLLESCVSLVSECVAVGLSHLSPAIRERFATIATWAQGAECYRLALLLRRVTDHLEQLEARAGGADEHRLLDELTLVLGLASAIRAVPESAAVPTHLLGRARTSYERTAALDLHGLGAFPWRSGSGYCGLTLLFWCAAAGRYHSCTDARPESTMGFNPVLRYRASGPWSGLGAPQQVTGRVVQLANPTMNAEGRLAANEQISASLPAVAFGEGPPAETTWRTLTQRRPAGRRSLLAPQAALREWAVVQPTRVETPTYDEQRQCLVWNLIDTEDVVLPCEVLFSEYTQPVIARIEQWATAGLPPGTRIVCRLRKGADDSDVVEPISLIVPGREPAVASLYFDEAPAAKKAGRLARWFSRAPEAASASLPSAPAPEAAVPEAVRTLRHWLRQQAERGIASTADLKSRGEFDRQLAHCADAGLMSFQRLGGGTGPLPARLLRANYLAMQLGALADVAGVGVE